jgi:hypothetical protein
MAGVAVGEQEAIESIHAFRTKILPNDTIVITQGSSIE